MARRSGARWLACLLLAAVDARAAFFTGLGDLPGGATFSEAFGVSADGQVVAGVSSSSVSSLEPFRWTQRGGMQGLGLAPHASAASCNAISGDGSAIVGGMIGGDSQAYRWTEAAGFESLGTLAGGISEALGVSADGSVIVGASSLTGGEAFRWTASDGMKPLGFLPGGVFSTAQGVSDDGAVVVGYGDSSHTTSEPVGKDEAFRWTASDGMLHSLGDLAGGYFNSRAFGVSRDGKVAVGESESGAGIDAIRYAGSMESLGDFDATAFAASRDGSVIVGGAVFRAGHAQEAFVWDASDGLRRLADVLSGTPALAHWTLGPARGVSADGNTLVGWGTDPAGHTQAWLAQLPEPDAALLQGGALGALALLAARRARAAAQRPCFICRRIDSDFSSSASGIRPAR